jgi:hypothetical protein
LRPRSGRLGRLPYTGPPICDLDRGVNGAGGFVVKVKVLLVILLTLGGFAVWRKMQADRAELDLWTEATSADEG